MAECPAEANLREEEQSLSKDISRIQKRGQDREFQYSMPGVLQYFREDWMNIEDERAERALEKAKLETRIAFLEGQLTQGKILLQSMVRRIKMMEYALSQERKKNRSRMCKRNLGLFSEEFTVLKTDEIVNLSSNENTLIQNIDGNNVMGSSEVQASSNCELKLKSKLLQEYLKEMTCFDEVFSAVAAEKQNFLNRKQCSLKNDSQRVSSRNTAQEKNGELQRMNDFILPFKSLLRDNRFFEKNDTDDETSVDDSYELFYCSSPEDEES